MLGFFYLVDLLKLKNINSAYIFNHPKIKIQNSSIPIESKFSES